MARVLRIDHVAVAVKDIDAGIASYQKILGAELIERADLSMHDSRMTAAYLKVGDGLIVLDGAADPSGLIAKFIERRGEGLHHIAVMRPTPAESDAAERHFADLGAKILMEGRIGETIRFYYLDTEPLLKVIFESGTGHAVDLKPARVYP